MHSSIGMETRAPSTRWDDVRRGPSKAEVRAHVRKLANYRALIGQQQDARNQPPSVTAPEEQRLAA
ncbi:MAG TPA: hypothetical protein VHG92_13855 [Afifellaceae bacterium]|nr:hypothetical protein [Afifellaceae bacterium]